jgi:hypothetical protein
MGWFTWLRSWSVSFGVWRWGLYAERRVSNYPQCGLQHEGDAVILHIGKVRLLWGTRGSPADDTAKEPEPARKDGLEG